MRWLPFELHTHTPHSDGTHSLLEMCRTASELGIAGIALTDHNTVSGLADAEAVSRQTGITIIPGMEWTTFYGHMLTLGAPYCEWRDLGPHDIHKGISRVHEQGGIVGIAHPYSLGSPICTGCHWDYTISDWNQIDYIEVWHEMMPSMKNHNVPAFKQWTGLLNEGYRISATAGRDWHRSEPEDKLAAYTYIGLPDRPMQRSIADIIAAIRQGQLCLSMGPLLEVSLSLGNERYGLGDQVPLATVDTSAIAGLTVQITRSTQPERPWGAEEGNWIIVDSNQGELARLPASEHNGRPIMLPTEGLMWLRVRLFGIIDGVLTTIACTNPIYFSNGLLEEE
ncbi:CehA/McbA family metallohydrolase [Paenibacillus sp. FSL H7-0756]|uniref:CehA/McbA family metallohydrolase n=1 Tax=Paenibacillus sp. FSL H7-0756 TaxID=2954738 RepID=UPI0030F7EA5C